MGGKGTKSSKDTVSRCQYSDSGYSISPPIGSEGSRIAFMVDVIIHFIPDRYILDQNQIFDFT